MNFIRLKTTLVNTCLKLLTFEWESWKKEMMVLTRKIDNWPDPDYNILYLLIEEGLWLGSGSNHSF